MCAPRMVIGPSNGLGWKKPKVGPFAYTLFFRSHPGSHFGVTFRPSPRFPPQWWNLPTSQIYGKTRDSTGSSVWYLIRFPHASASIHDSPWIPGAVVLLAGFSAHFPVDSHAWHTRYLTHPEGAA